ncbi:extracellular solute-binding protein [Bifidobacterium aerophilum]|uniref:Extracellular solute-binding protein n=1 Tax=Bifidobacterium aerophilum TaxID=1798155 RepID=A0A6N9Z306_9BIFI|nr:extracellular solute-binding protein [Bifidobacterium aerophilum]NEG89017.1 extracellular solute-binding protein [Bifidobacterium aerophilum]
MKPITKMIAATAATVMSLSALAACGSSSSGSQTRVNADGKPVVKISVVHDVSNSPKMDEMSWTKELEAACDCDIEWTDLDTNQWQQQRPGMLTSGNIPDVAICAMDLASTLQFGNLFEDLKPHIDKQLPNVKKFFETYPNAEKVVTQDGHIYGLPSAKDSTNLNSAIRLMINKKWLDKLGLKEPTTWDELETVLKAFKTQDPNGNGKADEVPFSFAPLVTTTIGSNFIFGMMGSTGITTQLVKNTAGVNGYYVKDGKVGNFLVSDEYKSLVTMLNRFVDEGLLPKNTLTQDVNKYNADIQADPETVGVQVGFNELTSFGQNNMYDYVSLPPLKATASSEPSWDYNADEFMIVNGRLSVAKEAPNKDAIWKIVNALYSEKISVEQYVGSIPEFTTDKGNHHYEKTQVNAETQPKLEAIYGYFAGWIPPEVTLTSKDATSREQDDYVLKDVETAYGDIYKTLAESDDYMPSYVQPSTDQSTQLANINTAVTNYALSQFSKWVVNGGIDGEWDAYVQKLNNSGLEQGIQTWQKLYDENVK